MGRVLRLTVREVVGGVCSPWLCNVNVGTELQCLPPHRPSPLVSAWENLHRVGLTPPLLLVAAGAGIAPFIALLDLLSKLPTVRQHCTLWMGCRHAQDALPHSARLQGFIQSGVLHRL